MDSDTIENVIRDFCLEFLQSPYLCYTEQGLHALFFCKLYSEIPENERYVPFKGKKVCIIQNEYPTAGKLGKPRRQHWDVAILQVPAQPVPRKCPPYDYLKLHSVVEFGLNYDENHLKEDICRLSHPCSYVENKFIIHLYRISGSERSRKMSERDLSPGSKGVVDPCRVSCFIRKIGSSVTVYLGVADTTFHCASGLWVINRIGVVKVE